MPPGSGNGTYGGGFGGGLGWSDNNLRGEGRYKKLRTKSDADPRPKAETKGAKRGRRTLGPVVL